MPSTPNKRIKQRPKPERPGVLPFLCGYLATCLALLVLLASSALIHSCDKEHDNPGSKSPAEVLEIYIDKNGTKWAASSIGLLVYKNSIWQTIDNTHVSDKPVNDIAFGQSIDGPELWLATSDGVSAASYEIDDVISATTYSGGDIGFTSKSSQSISADMSQTIWIGSADEVAVYKENIWYSPVSAVDTITTIANDNRGMNFIGTRNSGVELFTQDVDAISSATVWTKDWSPLRSDAINHILIVDDTSQWYSTNKGVAFQRGYNFKNPADWETYTTAEGLISDTVHCSAREINGAMWFGTPKGISVFDKTTDTWTSYNSSNGLIDNKINTIAIDVDGSIWVGTPKGISKFDGASFTNYDLTDLPNY
jgi:ligand-binding sensor domain-containing protein